MTPTTQTTEVVQLLAQLISINSVNPSLVPGAMGEPEIATFIEGWLQGKGFETHWLEATPGRPSVVGIARGTGGGKSLLFNGHIDTVGVIGMETPFTPRIEGNRMYGRGAYDMKGGVAAMLIAAARAKELNLRGDVMVACVSDEEYASVGSFELTQHFRAHAAIVTEPSSLKAVVAHKGFVWLELETHGKAAHGSRPDLGVDAIAKMGKVLVGLEKLDLEMRAAPPHKLLGSGSIHASLISGGQELSSYPASCKLSIERRTIPGESHVMVEQQVRKILDSISASDPNFSYTLTMQLERKPHQIAEDDPTLKILLQKARELLERVPELEGAPFWTDCAVLSAAGIPTFLFGPHGEGAHAEQEWVDLESVEQCADIYLQTAQEFCR